MPSSNRTNSRQMQPCRPIGRMCVSRPVSSLHRRSISVHGTKQLRVRFHSETAGSNPTDTCLAFLPKPSSFPHQGCDGPETMHVAVTAQQQPHGIMVRRWGCSVFRTATALKFIHRTTPCLSCSAPVTLPAAASSSASQNGFLHEHARLAVRYAPRRSWHY
jgi:hypothetical protein